jgi:hypothetical protein
MKILALAIGVLIILFGLTALVWPEGLLRMGQYSLTQTGLYVIAALRIAIGLVLFLAATGSRAPRTLRVIGILVCVLGVVTALVTLEWARELMAWWSNHGPGFIRVAAVVVVGLGSFIAYSTAPRTR